MKRCMSVNYGSFVSLNSWEGTCTFDSDCEEYNSMGDKYICAKGYRNPDMGALNFDNVLTGFVTIFVMATLEGWTDVFTYVSKTFKDKIYINTNKFDEALQMLDEAFYKSKGLEQYPVYAYLNCTYISLLTKIEQNIKQKLN